MVNIFIIHGAYGYPGENWFPWMKSELEKLGHKVFVPKFPTPEGQSLQSWMKVFDEYVKHVNEDSIIIGHSIGPGLILRLLEKHKFRAAFLVAGFIGTLGFEEIDEINSTFFKDSIDWSTIKGNCKNITVIGSNDDPYVPLKKTNELAKKLDVKPIIISEGGHFNLNSGYDKFEFLLEEMKKGL